MNNKDNTQEFSLEEIMREFGTEDMDQTAPEALQEEPVVLTDIPEVTQEPETDAPEAAEAPELPEKGIVTGDTIPLPDLSQIPPADEMSDTIRLDDLADAIAQQQAQAEADEAAPEETSEETENGHPESYELSPEELPPPPIVFIPRSRLRELKKKLVAGPERRYYELSEIGLGRVQAAIFVSVLIVLLCGGATALYAAGMVMENRLRLMIFSQVLAMMVSALLGCYVIMDGIGDLLKGKFTLNTMLFFTLAACAVDAVFCLQELRVPCCAAFSLEMTMALWNRSLRRSTEMGQMDTLRKAVRLDGIVKTPDYFEGRPGIVRTEGRVEDFEDNYQAPTGPEKVQNIFALVSLALSIAIAVLSGMRHGVSLGIQILATSLLVAVPAGFFICQSRPAAILQRRLHMVGTVLCGWQGVKGLLGKAAFPLKDRDIFPQGSSKLNGVKFFGDREPDETIAYATALMKENDGGLRPVFEQLLKSRSGIQYGVENFRTYPGGGIGGEVNGEPVLLGSQNFLQDMGVEIPEGTMVSSAVYCSIDGQMSAVFAINYNRMKSAAAGLVTLASYRKITPVVLSRDFIIDEGFLRSKFGVKTKRFAFPEQELRRELEDHQADPELVACALTTQEGLASAAYAVTGARALRSSCRMGLAIHILGGIVGLLIMAALGYLGSTELLTPINVLLYQLVWLIPGLLITEWARTV